MVLVFIIIFALAAYFTPGFAQSNSPYGRATAFVSAVSSGGSASASAYSYVYPYYRNGGIRDCTYNRCTPTCSIPYPNDCPADSNPCNCPPGTIISQEDGQCVPEEECQKYANCKGDYNARIVECSNPCPSTCARPNSQDCPIRGCGPPGCECNGGYILSGINGKCIKVENCPGGDICGRNETFINCLVECPSLYCPVSESIVACGPSLPCTGECGCKYQYLRKSIYDHTCILESECPPANCERPNEEWNRCVPRCYSESCKDRNNVPVPGDCPFSPTECVPRCICKKGFYRNANRVCVPVQECPPSN